MPNTTITKAHRNGQSREEPASTLYKPQIKTGGWEHYHSPMKTNRTRSKQPSQKGSRINRVPKTDVTRQYKRLKLGASLLAD